ncbi:MAG TPA: hypothetical protein VH206_07015 [Xanthobacteraceae bacterium]|jgi:hypothetical protein|nr:hypothetical protein [Xanthobacteraceae bacterium]
MPARLRSLALLVALALSLISSQGADAELKSEWKFGGNLAQALMALPIASSMLGGDSVFGDSSFFDEQLLPFASQPTGGSLEGLFSRRGIVGGFAAGFLGAGALGLVFGHGVYGELSGIPSALGLIFQLSLIVMLMRLIWSRWRADKAAASAGLSPRELADAYGRIRHAAIPDIDTSGGNDPHGNTGDAVNRPT